MSDRTRSTRASRSAACSRSASRSRGVIIGPVTRRARERPQPKGPEHGVEHPKAVDATAGAHQQMALAEVAPAACMDVNRGGPCGGLAAGRHEVPRPARRRERTGRTRGRGHTAPHLPASISDLGPAGSPLVLAVSRHDPRKASMFCSSRSHGSRRRVSRFAAASSARGGCSRRTERSPQNSGSEGGSRSRAASKTCGRTTPPRTCSCSRRSPSSRRRSHRS